MTAAELAAVLTAAAGLVTAVAAAWHSIQTRRQLAAHAARASIAAARATAQRQPPGTAHM